MKILKKRIKKEKIRRQRISAGLKKFYRREKRLKNGLKRLKRRWKRISRTLEIYHIKKSEPIFKFFSLRKTKWKIKHVPLLDWELEVKRLAKINLKEGYKFSLIQIVVSDSLTYSTPLTLTENIDYTIKLAKKIINDYRVKKIKKIYYVGVRTNVHSAKNREGK